MGRIRATTLWTSSSAETRAALIRKALLDIATAALYWPPYRGEQDFIDGVVADALRDRGPDR